MFIRFVVWMSSNVLFSLIPLAVVPLLSAGDNFNVSVFLELLSNSDLLAVAFTIGVAASVNAFVKRSDRADSFRSARVLVACLTLVVTVIAAIFYVVLKSKAVVGPLAAPVVIQVIYVAIVIGAAVCEILPGDVR